MAKREKKSKKVTIDIQTWPKTENAYVSFTAATLVLSFYFLSLVYAQTGYSLGLYKLCLYQHLFFQKLGTKANTINAVPLGFPARTCVCCGVWLTGGPTQQRTYLM